MIEIYKDEDGYTIKGSKQHFIGVIDKLKKKDLESIYQELGRILGKIDYKREMEISRDKYIK